MLSSPLLTQTKGYIAGVWVPADSAKTFTVRNPANGKVLAKAPAMGPPEAVRAIKAAASAMQTPATVGQRRGWLTGLQDGLMRRQDEFARIITLENGKPLKEAKGEVAYAAGFYGYVAKHLDALDSHEVSDVARGGQWIIHHRPAGVAAMITPWNFPLAMIAKKLSGALGAGCACVIRPASETPLSMIALFSLMDELDMPPGLVNLVTGDGSTIGKIFCSQPDVRVVSFTGSTRVGRILIKQSANHVKKLSMELGGNAPFIVLDDADPKQAAEKLIPNKFRAGGQTCVCTNRILVHKSVEAPFVEAVVEHVKKLKVGDGMEEGTDIGPLINRDGFDKVAQHIQNAIDNGAIMVHGPKIKRPAHEWGAFHPPVVLTNVTTKMKVCREETFGPVIAIRTFENESEAIESANGTPYGLAAYLFTRNEARAQSIIAQLRFGHVGWNTGQGPTAEAPFGGMKQSGFGREGGIEGLMEFTETQTVVRD